ncbi:sulfatase [bacterium]|nr:sulfatase [Planctomicrobium sp.]MDB4802306.1 sulfatase [bacterium]
MYSTSQSSIVFASLLFSLLLTVVIPKEVAAFAELKQPNIVLILVDDLGWSDLGCYGHPYHRTPDIDRLASQGMRFTNGYSPAPICSASRASILTGKAVPRLGFEFVTKNEPGTQNLDIDVPLMTPPLTLNLSLEEKTIAESLQPLGYTTAFFGKWHVSQHYQNRYLAWHPEFGPSQQGFEVALEDFGDHPYAWKKKRPNDLPASEFHHDSMIGKTIDFILSEHPKPFFLMVSSFYVHTPVKNRTRWLVDSYEDLVPVDSPNRTKRLEYAAFVETLDHHVGTILQALDDSAQNENTLVVFISDNGGHPEFCANGPLRGSKWNLYEGGIRVPFIARWPGRIQRNSISDVPVIGYDLLPTFVDVAGGKATDIDGESIQAAFDPTKTMKDRSLIWHFPYYHPESTYSKAIEKIGVNDFEVSKTRPQSAIRNGQYKLLKFAEDQRTELYDIRVDFSEQHDLSGKLPQITQELHDQLEETLMQMNARRAVPRK